MQRESKLKLFEFGKMFRWLFEDGVKIDISFKILLLLNTWYSRARVSTGAKGAWHPRNFWTVMSGTC